MTLVPPVPLLTPTCQGRGWPAGGVTGVAAPNVVPLTQFFTVAAVTCAEEPPVTTVVVRICSTPLNVPVNVATSQPVFWWLSRSRRIWKVDVAAEAAGTKPAPRKRTAKAILDAVDFNRFMEKLLGRTSRAPPPATEGQTTGEQISDCGRHRWRSYTSLPP